MKVYYKTISNESPRAAVWLPLTGITYVGYTLREAKAVAKDDAAAMFGKTRKEISLVRLDSQPSM